MPAKHALYAGTLGVIVAVTGNLYAAAQSQPMPPNYSGVQTQIPGIFITPVPNAPFTADVKIVSHSRMPDGTEHVVTTINHIARGASGRIYNERRALVPVSFAGEPRLLQAHIYDPSTRLSTFYDPRLRLAREMVLRAPPSTPPQAQAPGVARTPAGVTETDLGTQTLDNVPLHGYRKSRLVPADLSGTGQPITIDDDYWYSEALSIYMIIRHNDPRTGEQLVAVTKVERTEPPAERFDVPADYKIVDETPPEAPRARQ